MKKTDPQWEWKMMRFVTSNGVSAYTRAKAYMDRLNMPYGQFKIIADHRPSGKTYVKIVPR